MSQQLKKSVRKPANAHRSVKTMTQGVPLKKSILSVPLRKGGSVTSKTNNGKLTVSSDKPKGVIETLSSIVDVGKDVIRDVSKVASGDPTVLLTAPSTLMKVVDVSKNVISNVTDTNGKKPVLSGAVKTEQDHKILSEIKKVTPVINTTQLPTSTANNVEMPALQQEAKVYPGGRRGFNIKASYRAGNISSAGNNADTWTGFPGGNTVHGTNSSIFGARVTDITYVHQLFRVNSISMSFVPLKGTDYQGNVMFNIADGIDTDMSTSTTMETVSQRENVVFGDLKSPLTLTVKGLGDWLWIYNSASRDPKFFASLKVGIATFNTANDPGGPATVPCGNIIFSYDIDVMSATEEAFSLGRLLKREIGFTWLGSTTKIHRDTFCLFLSYFLREYLRFEKLELKDQQKLLVDHHLTNLDLQSCFKNEIESQGKLDTYGAISDHCKKDRSFRPIGMYIRELLFDDPRMLYFITKYGIDPAKIIGELIARAYIFLDVENMFNEETPRSVIVRYILTLLQKYCYVIYRDFNPLELSQVMDLEEEMRETDPIIDE